MSQKLGEHGLLPCPWCGEPPRVIMRNRMYAVHCLNPRCDVEAFTEYKKSKGKVVRLWNTREEASP